jgi:hypothetical protein
MALNFLSESTQNFVETPTIGGFGYASSTNSFDDTFTEAYNTMLEKQVDITRDISTMVKHPNLANAYKDMMLDTLVQECEQMQADMDGEYGTHQFFAEQVSDMWDNAFNDYVKESAVSTLLPIKTLDLPVLVKQQLKLAAKDIIQTEVTKQPIIKKHLEQSWLVNKNDTTQRWKYPQCFFDGSFKEVYDAGKGEKLSDTPVELPAAGVDLVTTLTDVTGDKAKRSLLSMNTQIVSANIETAEGKKVKYVFNPAMRINMSDYQWLGGVIKGTVVSEDGDEVEVDDIVMGTVDLNANKVYLNSLNGTVKSVVFEGYLSNEFNERAITWEYTREEREFKIEDGTRYDAPYSLEELEDSKALLDIDLYKKTYNNITNVLTDMEDSKILAWLDDEFEKYNGVELNPLDFNSFVSEDEFDCDSTSITTALPSEYIDKMLKFKIDRIIIDMADKAKMEDMTFVIYGNPRFISLLAPSVNWVTRPGSTINGVKLDYSYGIMTSGDVKVQVVSTKKVNAKYDDGEKRYDGLRIIPFPISDEQFTFKHYKYTSHIVTGQNSAYRDSLRPGGSMTYVMGVSRYTNAAIQGIQTKVFISNAEKYIKLK